jgi:hypothetical protein
MSNSSDSENMPSPERSNVLTWPAFQYAGGTLPVRFVEQVLNTIPIHIVVLDSADVILWTNHEFAESDGAPKSHWSLPGDGIGASYVERIKQASAGGDVFATQALSGIRVPQQQPGSRHYRRPPANHQSQRRFQYLSGVGKHRYRA